jgi:antitoxin component of MazEF toxin-antitoxin module
MENQTNRWANNPSEKTQKASEEKLKNEDLESILSKITPENQHDTINFGKPKGEEII